VQTGSMTLGALLVVISYLARLYEPLRTITKKFGDLQNSFASAQRGFEILDEPQQIVDRPGARTLSRATGSVRFEHVSFGYADDGEVLHDVSFSVPPRARIGVVGPTGAGKTTLVSLLLRFYEPTDGEVTLDGVDVRDYRLTDLRRQFAVVLQEPVLFSSSIRENIAYGRPDADLNEIRAAAEAAGAHDFIAALPEGYDTLVGERGMRLSGGERQRISLARAFLKDAPVLVLDEPTSSVDVATEAAILATMQRLMEDRTTFFVTHRLASLKDCDFVLVVRDRQVLVTTPSDLRAGKRPVLHPPSDREAV